MRALLTDLVHQDLANPPLALLVHILLPVVFALLVPLGIIQVLVPLHAQYAVRVRIPIEQAEQLRVSLALLVPIAPLAGASAPTTNPAGSFSAAGAISFSTCPAGRYAAAAGSTECLSTPAGSFSAAGSSSFSTCGSGTYAGAGATSCTT